MTSELEQWAFASKLLEIHGNEVGTYTLATHMRATVLQNRDAWVGGGSD